MSWSLQVASQLQRLSQMLDMTPSGAAQKSGMAVAENRADGTNSKCGSKLQSRSGQPKKHKIKQNDVAQAEDQHNGRFKGQKAPNRQLGGSVSGSQKVKKKMASHLNVSGPGIGMEKQKPRRNVQKGKKARAAALHARVKIAVGGE